MTSLRIKCTSCGSDIIVGNDIDELICGCCLKAVDLDKAREISRSKEPSEFLIVNGVLVAYFGANSYDVRIPSGVKKIKSFVFRKGIRSVIVPEGVEEIAGDAFVCDFLEYVKLPSSLKSLGTEGARRSEASPTEGTWRSKAFPLERMIESPVKPTIVCSPEVKELLLDGIDPEARYAVERGITWR